MVASYVLALLAVVAGLLFAPFSNVLMGLLFVLVGLFFLVPIVVLSAIDDVQSSALSAAVRRAAMYAAVHMTNPKFR